MSGGSVPPMTATVEAPPATAPLRAKTGKAATQPPPQVIDAEPEPEVVEADAPTPSTEVAIPTRTSVAPIEDDTPTIEDDWEHERITIEGDELGVRKPTQQALAGYSLASSKYVSLRTRNDITGLFIARHLSPLSYERVFSRLMDPDDAAYTPATIGAVVNAIVGLATSGT